jgi:hypothetical protein
VRGRATSIVLLLAAAALALAAGCASTARDASRGSAEGALEGFRSDPTFARVHDDLGQEPSLGGIGRRFTAGVVTAVAAALPALEDPVVRIADRIAERVAERVALAARRHAAEADPLAAVDRLVRALARDAEARARAVLEGAIERARAAPVRAAAEDLGAAFARGAAREVTAAVSAEVARGLESALARAASVSVTPEMLDRIHAEIEQVSMHMSRGTYKEIQNQVQSDDTWKWGVAIGCAVLAAILILRAYREISRLRRIAESGGPGGTHQG